MRTEFTQMLSSLHESLISMGALCENAIENAIKMLSDEDEDLAKVVFDLEEKIDTKQIEIENICTKLLIRQQPVARDLRMITAAMRMVTDMERIGDQAADIAEISQQISPKNAFDNSILSRMAILTSKMVTNSIDAFVKQDIALANKVVASDDEVDTCFIQIKEQLFLIIQDKKPTGEFVLDLLMIAKYLERIGDHAVNIAEWVEYGIMGKMGA